MDWHELCITTDSPVVVAFNRVFELFAIVGCDDLWFSMIETTQYGTGTSAMDGRICPIVKMTVARRPRLENLQKRHGGRVHAGSSSQLAGQFVTADHHLFRDRPKLLLQRFRLPITCYENIAIAISVRILERLVPLRYLLVRHRRRNDDHHEHLGPGD